MGVFVSFILSLAADCISSLSELVNLFLVCTIPILSFVTLVITYAVGSRGDLAVSSVASQAEDHGLKTPAGTNI